MTPIEYPPTSENGVAIIFHIDGWQNADAAFTDVNINLNYIFLLFKIIILIISFFKKKIQYSMGKPCGQHNTTCSYLGDISVTKKDRTCQGIKICEYADSELLKMNHTIVDFDSDLRLKVNQELSPDNTKNNTFM